MANCHVYRSYRRKTDRGGLFCPSRIENGGLTKPKEKILVKVHWEKRPKNAEKPHLKETSI